MRREIFGDVDLDTADKRNIRLAYLLRSPYRFFTGRQLRTALKHADHHFEVYVLNKVVIGEGEPLPSKEWEMIPPPNDLRTDFILIERSPSLSDEEAKGVTNSTKWESPHFITSRPDHWRMFNVYRHLLIALDAVVQDFQRRAGAYQAILAPDGEQFEQNIEGVVFIVCPRNYCFRDDDCQRLLELMDARSGKTSVRIHIDEEEVRRRYAEGPLPDERIRELERVLGLQDRYIHYEFAHQSEVESDNHDYPASLLAAVIALESAHSAFVRIKLDAILPQELSEKKRDQKIDNLLREQGITALIQVTPYLFLPVEKQPSADVMEQCVRGISMRNAIMHAKVRGGRPEIRRLNSDEYHRAIGAILEVCKIFTQELELIPDPGSMASDSPA